MGGLMILDEID